VFIIFILLKNEKTKKKENQKEPNAIQKEEEE